MTDNLLSAVYTAMRGVQPPIQGSSVTVALSGGADSVALCHALTTLAPALGIRVAAAHLNHGLRGAESDRDEAFVRDFCAGLGIPLTCARLAPDGQKPSEAHLRRRRYAFLQAAAGDGYLVTGHTLTDACETLLLNMARGTRLGGLRGIPARRDRLLRPLLGLTRADTEAYCAAQGLAYVQDSTNAQPIYARNRVRAGALPALESVNPRAQQALGALMREAAAVYAFLDDAATALLRAAARPAAQPPTGAGAHGGCWDAAVLAGAPDVVLRQALTGLTAGRGDPDATRIGLLADMVRRGAGAVDWDKNTRFCCAGGLLWAAPRRADGPAALDFCLAAAPGRYDLGAAGILTITADGENCVEKPKINKKDLKNRLDYAKIASLLATDGAALQLRTRAPHDRYAPGRGRGDKTLKKWLNEAAVPPHLRNALPLLAVGSRVVWLAGSGAAEGFGADEAARQVWQMTWQPADGKEQI